MKYKIKGEWDTEPDEAVWIDGETGYVCEARRSRIGAWYGCVRLPENHILNDDKLQTEDFDLEVHGGVTFFDKKEDDFYWIGFDCAHEFDILPTFPIIQQRSDLITYKNLDYVKEECKKLAKQLKEISSYAVI